MRISRTLPPGKPLIMFNPRLASGDVGVGLNVRRMRTNFLGDFVSVMTSHDMPVGSAKDSRLSHRHNCMQVTTYSLRPVGDIGTVFRRWPGQWMVFVQDELIRGRYKLAAERPGRPAGDELDRIIAQALGRPSDGDSSADGEQPGFGEQLGQTIKSVQRFMRSLSN